MDFTRYIPSLIFDKIISHLWTRTKFGRLGFHQGSFEVCVVFSCISLFLLLFSHRSSF
uniref:Uncharacterized protein n=1 Tax=Anguilla anguilla TaxID=7936 RepID=A0A0E9Q7V1_ANGAN